ncbi:MAG: putative membrane protein [Flavobacteriaceae bacterium]|jgi:uncharacterized membrane protein|tara:strand:- start:1510 stop:1995 length:486 start_codon:yes stop_codon:yes gene_type:complete
MKNIILLSVLSFVFTFTSCKNDPFSKVESKNVEVASQRDAVSTNFAEMTFDKSSHDFGTINNGAPQETMFSYTNTGDSPLVVTDIKSTCGCTVPQGWSREPLSPGESSQFTVKFNGKGSNKVSKTVTVTANTKKGRETVRISAFINNPNSVKQPLLPKLNQ